MTTTINGDFAGPGVSGTVTAASGATVTAAVAGCWPSHSARFVIEASTDNGATWAAVPWSFDTELGADDPGDNYPFSGMWQPPYVHMTLTAPAAAKYRIRCATFTSGYASWTLSA